MVDHKDQGWVPIAMAELLQQNIFILSVLFTYDNSPTLVGCKKKTHRHHYMVGCVSIFKLTPNLL